MKIRSKGKGKGKGKAAGSGGHQRRECPEFVTADIETDPFRAWATVVEQRIPQPFAAGVHDGDQTWLYWGADCVASMVAKCVELGKVVYMHNGGNFDFHYVLPHLDIERVEILRVGGKRIVQMKLPGKTPAVFRDSYALVPKPLRSWGKGDMDYAKLEKENRETNKDEILSYLTMDLVSLYTLMKAAQAHNGADYLTLASASFAALKAGLPEKFAAVSEHFDTTYRTYYYAGRVEIRRYGRVPGRWEVYDINSAFPHAMLGMHWWGSKCTMTETRPKENVGPCFVDVTCRSNRAFPLRGKTTVEYPQGRERFQVTGWEFLAAERLGLMLDAEIHCWHVPHELMNYGDFVLPRYALKISAENEGDKAGRFFAKLELNSAYGKTGQNPLLFSDVRGMPLGKYPMKEYKTKNGRTQRVIDTSWELSNDDEQAGISFFTRPTYGPHSNKIPRYNNVAIAASVTGFVRARMMAAIHECGAVYADTDSVFIPEGRAGSLKVGSGLGDWKHEFTFDELWLGGKKLYAGKGTEPGSDAVKWKTASKGVRLLPDEIVRVCEGETMRSNFDAPTFSLSSRTRFVSRRVKMPEDWANRWIRDDEQF